MNDRYLVNRRQIIGVYGVLALLLLVGSFFDFAISNATFNITDPIAMFFAAYGEYPATLGFTAAGTLLFLGRNREKKFVSVCSALPVSSW